MRAVNNLTWAVLDRTIEKLARSGVSATDAPALREPKRAWSYARLLSEVGRVGNALRTLGLLPGDRVALLMHDGVELAACLLGAARAGLCPVPLASTLRPRELEQALRLSGAVAAITHGDLAEALTLLASKLSRLRHLLCLGGGPSQRGQHDFGALCADADPRLEPIPLPSDTPALLLFETAPDGGQQGYAYPVAAPLLAFESFAASTLALAPEDRVFSASRLATATGLGLGLLFPLRVGAMSFLLPGPVRPRAVFDVLGSFKPTLFSAAPGLYHELLQDYLELSAPRPSYFRSVRVALAGSEPMPPAVERRLRAVFQLETLPCFCLPEGFHAVLAGVHAMPGPSAQTPPLWTPLVSGSVTAPPLPTTPPAGTTLPPSSVSPNPAKEQSGAHNLHTWQKGARPLPGINARICDAGGREVPEAEIGQLHLRGPQLLCSLWAAPAPPSPPSVTESGDATPAVSDPGSGWVVTPERFFRDAEGCFYHVGRADGMFRVNDRLVSPREIEQTLLGHPAVWECAVSEDATEEGLVQTKAYVVLNVGKDPSARLARELLDFVRGQLSPHKAPQAVEFLPSLPRGEDGRVLRWRLRSPRQTPAPHSPPVPPAPPAPDREGRSPAVHEK